MQSDVSGRINDICSNVIVEIFKNNDGNWTNVGDIILTCLQRLQIPCFEALGLSVTSVPAISLLVSMHNDVDIYIRTYSSIKSIITLDDLEHDLMQYLKSRCYPSLPLSSPSSSLLSSTYKDPNEIDLYKYDEHVSRKARFNDATNTNTTGDNTIRKISTFDDYGIGSLCKHPIVMQMFNIDHCNDIGRLHCCRCSRIKTNTDLLKTNDVIQYLTTYMRDISDDENEDIHFTNRFINFINEQLSPLSISDYGVYIQGDLIREKLIVQNILNAETKLMVDLKRKELERLNKFTDSNGNYANVNISNMDQFSIKLKRPERPVIEEFLTSVKSTLDEGTSSSKSRAKIMQAVQSHIDSSSSLSSNETKKMIRTQLIEIAAEYSMLYLGKSSYRKKLIDISEPIGDNINDSIMLKEVQPAVTIIGNNGNNSNFETNRYLNNDIYNENFTKLNPYKRVLSNNSNSRMGIMIIPPENLASCIPANAFDINDTHSVGRWGEALVYQYLVLKENKSRITWMNLEEEVRASYDITMSTPTDDNREITTYIEVKTTRYPYNNVFELSLWEWEFATKKPQVNYNIYRVFNAGDPKTVRIAIIEDVLRMIAEGSLKLCLAI